MTTDATGAGMEMPEEPQRFGVPIEYGVVSVSDQDGGPFVLTVDYDALRTFALHQAAKLAELSSALESARTNERRYLWLREHGGGVVFWPSVWMNDEAIQPLQDLFLDTVIDAAISSEGKSDE